MNKDTPLGVLLYIAVVAVNVLVVYRLHLGQVEQRGPGPAAPGRAGRAEPANRKLEATLAENAGLHQQLLTQAREAGVLDERQRMAREIHDTLAQGLTGIITQLQAAEQAVEDPSAWRRHFDAATRLARDSLSEARRSVEALRPEPLETARLSDALGEVAGRWSSLHGVPVQVTTTGTGCPMRPEAEFALLRTAQEALANVARHARATRVGVTLSYMEHQVALDVRDDGQGFDLKRSAPAAGSRCARERSATRTRHAPVDGLVGPAAATDSAAAEPARRRLRPGGHAPADRGPVRHAAGGVRAGLRHRHLGLRPARTGGGPGVTRPEPDRPGPPLRGRPDPPAHRG